MNACTIVARNYLPHARVLAESFREHHPGGSFTVLLLDERPASVEGEPFEVLGPYDLGIGRRELHRMGMIYDLKELATAVKPWLLQRLLARNGDEITFFDPDIQVFAPLDDVAEHARRHSVVLTPHTTDPVPNDGFLPDDRMILQAGIYNLGFIAVGPGSGPFLDWWGERLARNCLVAVERALFVDQRWIDFVPALFDHYVLHDHTCNVAYWNLHTRTLAWDGDRYVVDGRPLRFFHFSGFDPSTPELLSRHAGANPRILLSEQPEVARLCAEYARRLEERGYGSEPPGHAFDSLASGLPIDARMRRLYRDALADAEESGSAEPPDPFDASTAGEFLAWLAEPGGDAQRGISRYLLALYRDRQDLQTAFPDLGGYDAAPYLRWVRVAGCHEEQIPEELLPPLEGTSPSTVATTRAAENLERGLRQIADAHPSVARAKPLLRALRRARRRSAELPASGPPANDAPGYALEIAADPTPGVNLVGYFRAELGIAEVARKLVAAVDHAGLDHSTITYDRTVNRQEHPFVGHAEGKLRYDTNIICVNADQMRVLSGDLGAQFFDKRYSIGVWFWEVERFPASLHQAFPLVDEIWVASEFVRRAIAAETSKPVHIVPLPLDQQPAGARSRADLGLPEGFLFLFSFDFQSVLERKNPLGLIDAFTRAFEAGEGPHLVIKSINGDRDVAGLERLRLAARDRPDIHILDGYVSDNENRALTAACDCYVSLHRSEGLGLTMAEAMACAKPVIATAYSGNLTFMDERNSYLVPYRLKQIPPGCEPYPVSARWAEPDLEQAAGLMRLVYERPDDAREVGRRARESVVDTHSVDRTAEFVAERLAEVRRGAPEWPRGAGRYVQSALQGAERRLAGGAGAAFARRPRRGAPVALARRSLLRLLWPQIVHQYELDLAAVDALRGLRDEQLAQLRLLGEQEERLAQEKARLLRDEDLLEEAAERLARHEQRVASESERLSRTEGQLARQREILEQLTEEVSHLNQPPYSSDPTAFQTTDSEGRPAIGYRGGSPPSARSDVYRRFEDVFRGSETFIRERQNVYVEMVGSHGPVLDVGCGRGEFLDLLAEAGVPATGVDIDPGMIERCREKGHTVAEGDALEHLDHQPDESLGTIFAAQVIEHLSYPSLLRLIELAHRKLKPDGLLIAETVNPHSIAALKAFWIDPTHTTPVFPEVAVTLCRLQGFESALVVFPNGEGDLATDRESQGEYAVVASKGGA